MSSKSSIKRDNKYYEALGSVPKGILSYMDFYRYLFVKSYIYGNSVIDVGCARGDFLKSIISDYQVAGIEVTKQRVKDCNKILGQNVVKLCNLEENIDMEHNCYDSVVCMEVLEHLINYQETLCQLIKISKKRIIITVPCDEKIQWLLCVHCARHTPLSGHLHSFNEIKIMQCLDHCIKNVEIIKLMRFGNSILRFLPIFVPFKLKFLIDMVFCRLFPNNAAWMILVVDKRHDSEFKK